MPSSAPSSPPAASPDALAREAAGHAALIRDAFAGFQSRFQVLTRRAARRFAERQYQRMRSDASERLSLYRAIVNQVEADIRHRLGARVHHKALWMHMHAAYADLVAARKDVELAETFFNSITRRIFDTVGVDPKIEFVTPDYEAGVHPDDADVTRTLLVEPAVRPDVPAPTDAADSTRRAARAFAEAFFDAYASPRIPFADRARDAAALAGVLEDRRRALDAGPLRRADLVRPVFYRGVGAYVVGRVHFGTYTVPFAACFHNTDDGITLDAVLLDEDDISILFSFAHSYFHVAVERPHLLVTFLNEILPRKRRAELYIAIGYNKHGKTELYRDLMRHFDRADDQFVRAEGQRGMVMTVFTMPSYDMVFKLIKDRFDYPKQTTRREVMGRYHLVFKHDRAGRLVDAQEFEHLKLRRDLFAPELLRELQSIAGDTVHASDEHVTIDHTYVERRVTPLDVFLRTRPFAEARAAVIDYGQAITDLARANIFPGDLLLKNFGVTRHGRVVFYDYDELCFVTDCTFRTKPKAQTYEQEMRAGAWFYVAPEDVFPEEFLPTLGLSDALRRVLVKQHGAVFTAAFWNETKKQIEGGAFLPILPYPVSYRLPYRVR